MANVQVFLAVPFAVGAPDAFVQELQAFVEQLLAHGPTAGPANPVLVGTPVLAPGQAAVRQEPNTDLVTIAASLEAKLGFSPDSTRQSLISAQIRCEKPAGEWSQYNNPLNTTLVTAHSIGSANSVGVQIYDSLDNGLDAIAATLQQGNMHDILQALAAADPRAFVNALGADPWGTSPACVASVLGI